MHQEIVGELYFQLRLALEGKPYRPYIAPFDIRLPRPGEADEQVDTVVQPDYRLDAGRYGNPAILDLKGGTAIKALPGVSIDWDAGTTRFR